jgi:hypothetical protein
MQPPLHPPPSIWDQPPPWISVLWALTKRRSWRRRTARKAQRWRQPLVAAGDVGPAQLCCRILKNRRPPVRPQISVTGRIQHSRPPQILSGLTSRGGASRGSSVGDRPGSHRAEKKNWPRPRSRSTDPDPISLSISIRDRANRPKSLP